MNTKDNNPVKNNQPDKVVARISSALRGLRYGSVILTVHDSRIVQIERVEKNRFEDLYLENGEGI
ncbi:MAG: YezD family protein [Fibrobacter sp.]|nr:YezD family protein [Fibrobacter sp.]